jgi:hypothetical protein
MKGSILRLIFGLSLAAFKYQNLGAGWMRLRFYQFPQPDQVRIRWGSAADVLCSGQDYQ